MFGLWQKLDLTSGSSHVKERVSTNNLDNSTPIKESIKRAIKDFTNNPDYSKQI